MWYATNVRARQIVTFLVLASIAHRVLSCEYTPVWAGRGSTLKIEGGWQCASGQCVDPIFKCNGTSECDDGSEETPLACSQGGNSIPSQRFSLTRGEIL